MCFKMRRCKETVWKVDFFHVFSCKPRQGKLHPHLLTPYCSIWKSEWLVQSGTSVLDRCSLPGISSLERFSFMVLALSLVMLVHRLWSPQ